MKLGLTVVYLVHPQNEGLLRLHLNQIARHTTMPYRIYAAAHRLAPQFRPLLDRDDTAVVALPDRGYEGSTEHADYLRGLVETAVADGCSHVCMLHVDSFPIVRGWDETLRGHLEDGAAIAATLLDERVDMHLPQTSCLFFPAEFYRAHGPIRVLPHQPSDDPAFEAFRRQRMWEDSAMILGVLAAARGPALASPATQQSGQRSRVLGRRIR